MSKSSRAAMFSSIHRKLDKVLTKGPALLPIVRITVDAWLREIKRPSSSFVALGRATKPRLR